MPSAIVYRVLAALCAIAFTVLAVATVIEGKPAALTILIGICGFFTTAIALINAHYAH